MPPVVAGDSVGRNDTVKSGLPIKVKDPDKWKDSVNSNSLINLNKGLQSLGFRTQEQWTKISKDIFTPYYTKPFKPGCDSPVRYMIYPYWQGTLFTNYCFENIERIGYFGYLVDPWRGTPNLTYSYTVNDVIERAKLYNTRVDLVVYCSGKNETDIFLNSEKARAECIVQSIRFVNERKKFPSVDTSEDSLYNADGINIFFPDFSFEKKREFGLFIKDIFWLFRYNNPSKKLIVTFPERDTVQYIYLEGLKKYIDEIYFADYDYRGMIRDTAVTFAYARNYDDGKNNLNVFQEMISEIRLARFYNPLQEDFIAEHEGHWITYLLAIVLIFFVILVSALFNLFWSKFNQFINDNKSIVFLVVALLLTEVIFLFIFMVEEMNFDVWLINTSNPGSYYFLLLPLILIFLFPLIKIIQKQRELP